MQVIYERPNGISRTQTIVLNSRFICIVNQVQSVIEAREFLAEMRAEMLDASHHVYAFRVGFGNSVVEGMSDDGEPSGTAGPPVLAVLRGVNLGDIVVLIARYFGGTKLGTGGLVRAYTESVQNGLISLKTEYNIVKIKLGIDIPYPLYEKLKRLIKVYNGIIEDEFFDTKVTVILDIAIDNLATIEHEVNEISGGQVTVVKFD